MDAVKALYPYALSEGEGVGTAYEYVAKAEFVRPLVARLGRGRRMLVAGLPEKYGTSLDFAILAHRLDAELQVVDERAGAIERARRAVDAVQSAGRLRGLRVTYRMLTALEELSGLEQHDAVLSCEVLQRVPRASRAALATVLRSLAPMGAVFVPNAENASHLAISGLAGLSMRELRGLFGAATFGYVDMPPFPPGIARSAEQRAKASTGRLEAIAMRVLNVYCSAERWLPAVVKRRFAHIVCAMWGA